MYLVFENFDFFSGVLFLRCWYFEVRYQGGCDEMSAVGVGVGCVGMSESLNCRLL